MTVKNKAKTRQQRTRGKLPDLLEKMESWPEPFAPPRLRRHTDLLGEYREEVLSEVYSLRCAGATVEEIADWLGVAAKTLYDWARKDDAFAQCFKEKDAAIVDRVRKSLVKRAVGFHYRDTEIRTVDKKVVKVPVLRYEQPNVTAQIFFLKNRDPENWSDRVEGSFTGEVSVKDDTDPRRLAMAIIAALRDAAAAPRIEHDNEEVKP